MSISVPYVVLVAKQLEIQELQRLKTRAHMVGVIGHMVHALQSERGASSIFLASSGTRFEQTRLQLVGESQKVEKTLRSVIEHELSYASYSNAKILSLMAWVLLGLDALPDLRARISAHQLTGSDSVAAFSRIIAGMIGLTFELAEASLDPEITRLLVALLNLIEGKEFAGQERAFGALAFGSGHCNQALQQHIAHLVDAQQRSFRIFQEFAEKPLLEQWETLDGRAFSQQLHRMRKQLIPSEGEITLDANLSDAWFECCSERLTAIWEIQCALVERMQQRCEQLNFDAECALLDSEGLLRALREKPPARAAGVDRIPDPHRVDGMSLDAAVAGRADQLPSSTIIDLLQAQSQHLARVEVELEKAKRTLNERKLIERAKGVLMAREHLTEEQAHKQMRTTSMDLNLRLVEIAEQVLARS
ncbi:MAG: nitrate- and nitrite sensing domain-containing protein [Candidatus Thiodiazotropha sp.]